MTSQSSRKKSASPSQSASFAVRVTQSLEVSGTTLSDMSVWIQRVDHCREIDGFVINFHGNHDIVFLIEDPSKFIHSE